MNQWLEFTLSVSPCLGCKVCPQSALAGAYHGEKIMDASTFIAIVDKLPSGMDVHFSGFSEPFLHPQAVLMMDHAARLGHPVSLYTTLMGLRERDIGLLSGIKFKYVKLHLPDLQHLKIDTDVWLRQYDLWHRTNNQFEAMAMGPLDPKIPKTIRRFVEIPKMLSRAGNAWRVDGKIQGKVRCAADRWHNNVVLPNGDVVLCCMDWALTMPLGNLRFNSYSEIYTNAEKLRLNYDPPADSICRSCEWGAPL